MSRGQQHVVAKGLPPSKGPAADPPAPSPRASERCPATIRHTPSFSVITVGVQCKYTRGHDGDHAGHAGFSEGDVFWPQEAAP